MDAFVIHNIVANAIQFESNPSGFFFNFWHNLIKESVDSHYIINKDSERKKVIWFHISVGLNVHFCTHFTQILYLWSLGSLSDSSHSSFFQML